MGAVASFGGRCWIPVGRYSLSSGDSWQERVCNLTSVVFLKLIFLCFLTLNWFALHVVRKECELWSLVMSIDGGIWGEVGGFFLEGALGLGILALC